MRAPLPDSLETQIVSPLGELPTGSVHYHRDGINSTSLDGLVELGLEYLDGGTWVEPPNCRFLTMRGSFDHLEETPTRKYSLIGVGWMLRRAKVWEANGLPVDADGKVQFLSANAGTIMATLIQNAKRRGWGAGIGVDFTATQDSAGKAWDKILTIAYDLELDLEAILSNLYQQGVCDYRWEGRTLRIFNPGTLMARELSTGANPVRLMVADGQTSAPEEWTNEDMLTDAMVLGEEGKRWEFSNNVNGPLGRLENVITQGGVSDPGTASLLAEADLLTGSQTRVSYTREFVLADHSTVHPFRSYQVGDWVLGQRGVAFERLRVVSLSLTMNADGVKGHAVLGDRLEDLLTKLAKRTKGITGGSSTGGSGIRPAPEGPDTRTPAAPSGLVVGVDAYIDDAGVARGRIDADWAHSGNATNGTAMTIDRYQVFYRVNELGTIWKQLTSTQDTELQYSPLPVFKADGVTPEQFAFKVRAIGNNGRASGFSGVVAVQMEDDVTPPPVPQFLAENLTTWLRTVTVRWGGKGMAGTSTVDMPRDFDHINVYQGASPTGPWTLVGAIGASHELWQSGTMPTTAVWFTLTSVDRSGNESAMSVVQMVTPTANVDMKEITAKLNAAEVQITNAGQMMLESGETLRKKLADSDTAIGEASADLDNLRDVELPALEVDLTRAQGRIDAVAGQVSPLATGLATLNNTTIPGLQTSINAKTTIQRSTLAATNAGNYSLGDRWERWSTLSTGGKLLQTWRHNGSAWIEEALDASYIPLLDIGTATFGSVSGGRLDANSVTADKVMIGLGENMVPNAGAEVGSISPHTSLGGTTVSVGAASLAHSGVGAFHIGANPAINSWTRVLRLNSGTTGGGRMNGFAIDPSSDYYVELWYRGGSLVANHMFRFDLVVMGLDSVGLNTLSSAEVRLESNTYRKLVFQIPSNLISSSAVTADLYISTNGPSNFIVDDIVFQKQVQGALIVNGSITGDQVNAESVGAKVGAFVSADIGKLVVTGNARLSDVVARRIAADSGQFVSADIGKLVVTGSSQMAEATIDRLWGDVLNYRQIGTNQLTISPYNMMPDPLNMDAKITTARLTDPNTTAGWVSGADPDTSYTGNVFRRDDSFSTAMQVFRFNPTNYPADLRMPVMPGKTYAISFNYRFRGTANASGTSTVIPVAWYDNANKGYLTAQTGPSTVGVAGTAFAWKTITQKFVAPEGAAYMRLGAQIINAGYARVEIGQSRVHLATDDELIVDGAILAKHLTVTEEMWAKIINFQKLRGDQIAANSITSDQLDVGAVRAAILTANSVNATMLAAGAITAKHTMTGPLYQTTATSNSGIKISDTLKFRVYDDTGNLRVHLGSGASDLVAVPELRTAPRGQKGIAIINSWQQGQPALVLSETGSVGTSEPAIWVDAYKIMNIQGLATSTAPYGLVNVKGQLSVGDYWESGSLNAASFIANRNTVQSLVGASELIVQSGFMEMRRTGTLRSLGVDASSIYMKYQERSLVMTGTGTTVTGPFSVNGTKNFVMPHPLDPDNRELLHASTESPVSGVEYWGEGVVGEDGTATINLPDYFDALTKPAGRVALVTGNGAVLSWTPITEGSFVVSGEPGASFGWLVKAERYGGDFEVERPSATEPDPTAEPPASAVAFARSVGPRHWRSDEQRAAAQS